MRPPKPHWRISIANVNALPYAADSRKLIRIGANFDSRARTLDQWKVV